MKAYSIEGHQGWSRWPRLAAAVVSLAGLIFITLVPALKGPVEFSPSIALNWLELIAVAWAAAFAAENLSEFRLARLAEILPLVDVGLRRGYDAGQPQLALSFRNLGRGHATGFEATIWQLDQDGLYWVPEKLSDLPDLIAPSEVLKEVRKENEWIKYAIQGKPCDLIVEATFRDPLRRHHRVTLAYKIGGLLDELTEVSVPVRPSLDVKTRAIREMLDRIESDLGLSQQNQCLTVDAENHALIVNYLAGADAVLAWNVSLEISIHELEDLVRRGIEQKRLTP